MNTKLHSLFSTALRTNVALFLETRNPPAEMEPSPNGFGEVNAHTNGTEFYGPTATLAFLLELRSRARSFQSQNSLNRSELPATRSEQSESQKLSIVNFFHGDDSALSGTKAKGP